MSPPRLDPTRAQLAFVFPGVGVRPCGYEASFFERHAGVMRPILERASRYCGADLIDAISDSPGALTELQTQLACYAFNVAVASVYLESGYRPMLMAGHSMGIYSALVTAKAVSFEHGLRIVEAAFRVVAAAASRHDCAMAVIVGLEQPEIDEILSERPTSDTTLLVNSNNDTTKIFAGQRSDLESFIETAVAHDALKARLMPVTSPYHHPARLDGAIPRLEAKLRRYDWSDAAVPIVSSIDQRLLVDGESLIDLTARNIATPISWEKVVQKLVAERTQLFIECGAGLSLQQNGRMMEGCPPFVTVKNAEKRAGL